MIVIFGLIVMLAAVVVGFTGVLANSGGAHVVDDGFSVVGYHVTGSTGTVFLLGIVVGAIAVFGLSALLTGARRTAERARATRRELARSRRETEFLNREFDDRLEPGQGAPLTDKRMGLQQSVSGRRKVSVFDRWAHDRPAWRAPVESDRGHPAADTVSPRRRTLNTNN